MMLDELTPDIRHRIIATDIDQRILERASRGGPFTASEVKNVGSNLVKKYLEPVENGYAATKPLRDRVTFKIQDLLKDRFDTGFDLILCRNVVIYFTDEAKQRLNHRFYESLKPGVFCSSEGLRLFWMPSSMALKGCFPRFTGSQRRRE